MRCLDSITDSMDMNLSKLQDIVKDRGAWLEKEMATHSSVLAWRIPGTGEPVGLPPMGSRKSRTRLKRLSSSSSRVRIEYWQSGIWRREYIACLFQEGFLTSF